MLLFFYIITTKIIIIIIITCIEFSLNNRLLHRIDKLWIFVGLDISADLINIQNNNFLSLLSSILNAIK